MLTATGDFTSILFPFYAQSGHGIRVREVPLDASRFAYTACGGYQWLLSPRGTAYFTINPTLTASTK